MEKKKWMAVAMVWAITFIAACGSPDEVAPVMQEVAGMEIQAMTPMAERKQAEGMDVAYAQAGHLVVYYSNGKADGLEKELVEVDAVTPEQVVSSLSRHNIVSIDTKVLGFEIKEPDAQGRKILGLDLSKAFGEYMKTMGEDCEGVLLAALANTFLENYQADALFLTVDGEALETRHGVYDREFIHQGDGPWEE